VFWKQAGLAFFACTSVTRFGNHFAKPPHYSASYGVKRQLRFIVYFMQEMNRFGEKGLIWSKSIGKNYSVTGIHIQYYSYLLTL